MALIDKLTALGDAIRNKTGKTEKLTLDQMAAEIADIQTGGNDDQASVARAIVDRTITEFSDDVLTTVGSNAFYSCNNLISVSIPKVTYIGTAAFTSCWKLRSISLPSVENIGNSGFSSCSSLTSVSIPKVTYINRSVFSSCSSLTSVTLPTTPPTIQSNSFSGINSACVFHIPIGSLSAYQSATNWSTLTEQYQFVEDA